MPIDTQFTVNQAQQIAKLQTQFNQGLDPAWPTAPTLARDDFAAVIVELGERYEHLGYKWWKKQQADHDQANMELIDVLHFAVSDVIEVLVEDGSASPIETAALKLLRTKHVLLNKQLKHSVVQLKRRLVLFVRVLLNVNESLKQRSSVVLRLQLGYWRESTMILILTASTIPVTSRTPGCVINTDTLRTLSVRLVFILSSIWNGQKHESGRSLTK